MNKKIRVITLAAVVMALCTGAGFAHGGRGMDRAFQVRLGGFFPEGGDDLWTDNEEVFTMDISDFDGIVVGVSLVGAVSNNLEVALNADFYEETNLSAYRGWVDDFGYAIYHDTTLSMLPLTVDLRLMPFGRYRERGHRRVMKPVPYIGGGIGVAFWEYEEVGDFLDFSFQPPEVFYDRFVDDGAAFEYHAVAGVELPMSRDVSIFFEGRYTWADDNLSGDFSGFGDLNLDGAIFSVGGSWKF